MKAQVVDGVVIDIMEVPRGHADKWVEDDGTAEVGCLWNEAQGFHNQSGMPPQKVVNRLFYMILKHNIQADNLTVPPEAADLYQRIKDHIK